MCTTLFKLFLTLNAIMFAAPNTLFSFGGKWWRQDTGDVNGYLTSEFRQVLNNVISKGLLYETLKGENRSPT